jgi:hypothetical protein
MKNYKVIKEDEFGKMWKQVHADLKEVASRAAAT